MITVTDADGLAFTNVKWQSLPPWVRQPIITYHEIHGATAGGIMYSRGVDNGTTTLSGIVLRTSAGMADYDRMADAVLTVSDGLVTKTCRVVSVSLGSRSDSMTWVDVTLSLREVGTWQ